MDRARVAELFDLALDQPESRRAEWLREACAGDDVLRAEIERLLRADARASAFLERQPAILSESGEANAPRLFGPWRALKLIGAGGMGEVWLAERADGEFEQRVAVKQLAYPTPGLMHRFRQERQILARLEHPNIARLIDGGVAEDGVPYLVMEFVEGVPVTDYAREHALDARACLRLMLDIAEAVQYAHQNLVVHRDLKPSNILVAADGTPKLLDFGIAKVLTTTGAEAPTRTLARLMTPGYAAPEQFTGDRVTTATDVYALGVVLYEILARTLPPSAGHDASARDPTPPSAALDIGSPADAARRRALRGDIDRIVLTALARDPARRYASAEALAADIRRCLEGRPIAARADHVGYRLAKFARRNRYALGGATLVFAIAVVAAIVSVSQARRANEQAARAEAVRKFLVGVFDQASPDQSKGTRITVHELLDRSEPQVERELAGQPASRADVTTLLARLYQDIGDYSRAEALLESTVAGSDPATVPADIRARTLIALANLENEKHASDAAERHANAALALARSVDATDEISQARRALSGITINRGDSRLAEPALRAALAADIAAYGELHDAVAEDYSLLGTALDELTRYEESGDAFEKSIAISRELHGDLHKTVSTGLNALGLMLLHKGDLDRAEKVLQHCVEINVQLYGENTDNTWTVRSNLIRVLELEGRYREALAQRTSLVDAEERHADAARRDALAFAWNFIGVDHRELGELDAAEAAFKRSLELWKIVQGTNDTTWSATVYANLGGTLTLAGRYEEAESALATAVVIERKHEAPGSQWLAITRSLHGTLLRMRHRHDAALAELRESAAGVERDPSNPWLVLIDAPLAEAELDAGHADVAFDLAKRTLAHARRTMTPGNVRLVFALYAQGRAELARGDGAAAEALAREALAIRSKVLPPADVRMLELDALLIGALDLEGRSEDAAALRATTLPLLERSKSPYAADLLARIRPAGATRAAGAR